MLACDAAVSPTITQTQTQASITYSGTDGSIEYDWAAPAVGSSNSLGAIHIKNSLNGTQSGDIVLSPSFSTAGNSLRFQNSQWMIGKDGPVWALSYTSGIAMSQIYLQISLNGKLLNVTVSSTQPVISLLDIGPWLPSLNPKTIPVPYYAGNPPVYLQSNNLFAIAFCDWHSSNASGLDETGRQAVYNPLTNGALNTLSEKIIVGVSASLPDLFPDLGNSPSPYMSQLAGKTILDVWAGGFGDVTTALTRLSSYGIDNCALIVHNWQNSGFDNALPEHLPANSSLGGDSALNDLVHAGKSLGCSVGLHENYTDYYPNYPAFSLSAISVNSNKALVPQWFNPTTQILSFATKPTLLLTNASLQSPQIHSRYNTNSMFLDVSSSVTPWWLTDMDATTTGAGRFSSFMQANKDLWNYERTVYGGPVFGEGNHHAFWSGLLDGVEAQFGTGGVPTNIGAQAPLLVDFDLQAVHPRQVNHGMGYYERWVVPGDDYHRTDLLDAYRMQEVAFGHAPFIGGDLWANPARVLVEQNLVGPVAQRYGTQTISNVQYQFKGNWTDVNVASKANTWNRVQVRYSNGDTIVANGMPQTMVSQGLTLPAFGWVATGTHLLAYTALKNGLTVDYAETANTLFANARNQSDLTLSPFVAQVLVHSFSQERGIAGFQLQWRVLDYAPVDPYWTFVHLVSSNSLDDSGIVSQCDYKPAISTSTWKPGALLADSFSCPLSSNLADGSYSVRIGLYTPGGGAAVALYGVTDKSKRLVIGTLTLKNGKAVGFVVQPPVPNATADPRLNAAGVTVDFDTVRTDGMVSIVQNDNGTTLRTYPLYRNVVVQIKATRLLPPSASSVSCDSPNSAVQVTPVANGYWQIQMNGAKSCHW